MKGVIMKIIIEIDDGLVDELDKFENLKYYLTEEKDRRFCGFRKWQSNDKKISHSCFREKLKSGTIKLTLHKEIFK